MGYDDGDCEVALDGVHVFALDQVVLNATGSGLSKVRHCGACGAEVYEASEDPAARPPL